MRKIALFLGAFMFFSPAADADGGPVIIREIEPTAGPDWLILDEADLRAAGATTLGELLADVPGVFVNEAGTPGGLVTASFRGAAANQLLVLVDGVPINQATNGVADLSGLPLTEFERVEIRRGVGGNRYGGGAVGGVVNLVTKVTARSDGLFTLGLGSAGEQRYSLSLGRQLSPEVGFSARGWLAEHDGWRDNSDSGEMGFRVAARVSLSSHTIRGGYARWTKEQGLPGPRPAEGELPEFGSQEATSLFDNQKEHSQSATLNYHGRLGGVILHADLGWREHELSHFTRYRYLYPTEDQSRYLTTTYYGSAWGRFAIFEPVELEVGLDYRSSRLEARLDSTVWDADPFDPDEEGTTTTTQWSPTVDELGGWLEARAEPGLFTANARLRVDDHGAYGAQVTGGGGVGARLENLRLQLSGGTAFRPPTLNDLYWPTGGNPKLRPEEAWEAELGLVWEAPDLPGLTGEVYYRQTTDLIAWQPDETGLWWSPQNVDSQRVLGATTGLAFGSFTLGYTYTDARQRRSEVVYSDWATGELRTAMVERRAAFLPRHQLSLGYDAGFVQLLARWIGERTAYYPDYSGAPEVGMREKVIGPAWVFDVRAQYELTRGFRFFAAVENLTDAEAPAAFGNTAEDRDYPRAPRRFTIGAEMAF